MFYSNIKVLNLSARITVRRIFQFAVVLVLVGVVFSRITLNLGGYFAWVLVSAGVACVSLLMLVGVAFIFDKKTLLVGFEYLYGMVRGAIKR